jgi:GNAT superfamily N-acetyltransferase
MEGFSLRQARPEERIDLTRLCVRATRHLGYDDAFIERIMPQLTVTLRSIVEGNVQVCDSDGRSVLGVVWLDSPIVERVMSTTVRTIATLGGIFVEPSSWRRGIGRLLFGAVVARARERKADALMIHAEPSAEGFYQRLGAIRIGEGPFYSAPEVMLPQLLFPVP